MLITFMFLDKLNLPVISCGGDVKLDVCKHKLNTETSVADFSGDPHIIMCPEFSIISPKNVRCLHIVTT